MPRQSRLPRTGWPSRDVGFHLRGGVGRQPCSVWQEERRASALPLSFLTLFYFLFLFFRHDGQMP